MGNDKALVYGIGNTLIDIITSVEYEDLEKLNLSKGIMQLIDSNFREQLVEFMKDKTKVYSCGGSCPNTMLALSMLGVDTILAGKVGNDEFGKNYHKNLIKFNTKDELIDCDQATGSSIIFDTPDSERTMNTYLCANRLFNENDINEESIKKASYFYFTGYMWDTENQKNAIKKALKISKENNTKVVFDIADPFAVARYKNIFLDLIENEIDVVFANKEEARIMFETDDPVENCIKLGKICETAIVKNGIKGSIISYKGKIYNIPVHGSVNPVDTTGAGDVYAAGFIYGLCNNLSIEECGRIASILAGEIISQVGAQFTDKNMQKAIDLINN
ncbi:MAG: adenosine kinase [Sphaerochaetaceae bacterium]|nr:adenosine kinase [Sphaerochaetaceae bacterium]MDC7249705.1 adenosine kinase [Sphaerochaetaceae bacterium]